MPGGRHAGVDDFRGKQEPQVDPGDDPLARFVVDRIRDAETEPGIEVMAVYDQPAGPMAHRYAGHVRRDCRAFRWIVAAYLTAVTASINWEDTGDDPAEMDGRAQGLRAAVLVVANRWPDHPDFRDEWRLA